MKKSKPKKEKGVSPEKALIFIESIKQMLRDKDEPTVPISLRVPANLLKALKIKAKGHNAKYQSLIIQAIREELKKR